MKTKLLLSMFALSTSANTFKIKSQIVGGGSIKNESIKIKCVIKKDGITELSQEVEKRSKNIYSQDHYNNYKNNKNNKEAFETFIKAQPINKLNESLNKFLNQLINETKETTPQSPEDELIKAGISNKKELNLKLNIPTQYGAAPSYGLFLDFSKEKKENSKTTFGFLAGVIEVKTDWGIHSFKKQTAETNFDFNASKKNAQQNIAHLSNIDNVESLINSSLISMPTNFHTILSGADVFFGPYAEYSFTDKVSGSLGIVLNPFQEKISLLARSEYQINEDVSTVIYFKVDTPRSKFIELNIGLDPNNPAASTSIELSQGWQAHVGLGLSANLI